MGSGGEFLHLEKQRSGVSCTSKLPPVAFGPGLSAVCVASIAELEAITEKATILLARET